MTETRVRGVAAWMRGPSTADVGPDVGPNGRPDVGLNVGLNGGPDVGLNGRADVGADVRLDVGLNVELVRAGLVALMVIAGCGKSADRQEGATATGAGSAAVVVDVAAVNALVPAGLKDTLVFEKRELVIERGKRKTTYTIAAPRGWVQRSTMFAHLRADDRANMLTRLEVGSNCDGECRPKAWQAISDRVNFAPRAKGKVLKDEAAPGRRTMVAVVDSGGARTTDVVVAWWSDGARNYHTCTASLGEWFQEAAPAFDKACQAVAIDGDD